MSDEQQQLSDAEKMRLKRIARLGAPSTPAVPDAAQQESTPKAAERQQPVASSSRLLSTPIATPSPKTVSASTATPPLKLSSSLGKRPTRPIEISQPTLPPQQATPSQPKIPYQSWQRRKIQEIFSVTFNRSEAEKSDWRLCWLKGLEQEFHEEGVSPDINIDMIDRLLIARLSMDTSAMAASDDADLLQILAGMPTEETSFEYLIGCWKRLHQANREYHRIGYKDDTWGTSFDKIKALLISYCGMSLEDPTMFPQPVNKPTGPAEFLPLLLGIAPAAFGDPLTASSSSAPVSSGLLSADELLLFLNDLANGVSADQLSDTITPTLSLFFQEWFKIDPSPDIMGNEWRRYIGAVNTLVQVKAIAAALPTLPVWVAPGVTAPKIEWQSLLGPLTRLGVFPREFAQVWKTYFSDPTDRKKDDIDANKGNLRLTLNNLQTALFNIYNPVIRASPASREGILSFFAEVIKLNEKRAGMRVDPRTVSSDAFMVNLQVVLLKLFEPVMDASFSKIDKVDSEYYRHSRRIDISDETKVKAAKEEADSYFSADQVQDTPNFISDLFFLLNAFQHLGMVKTIGTRIRAEKNISEIEKELKRAEASRPDWQGNPATEQQGEAAIKKFKSDIATLHASIHAYDTQLLDKTLIRSNVSYLNFLMTWLIRMVDPNKKHPSVQISLPLPLDAPLQFRMLPEYLFDNIAEYFDFLSRYDPDALDNVDKDILITFAITFVAPGYVNNPFLKAKLVSILANGLVPVGYFRKGSLFDRLSVHTLSTQYLMPTMIRFFIDVEQTGGHSQFYDKFTFRRDISRIFKSTWENPLHREAFVKSRHDDFDQFIKFVNMLLNDTTFHLEEALSGLAKMNSLQQQMNGLDASDPTRADLSSQYQEAERSAPWHNQMGLDFVELLRDLTATTKEPFVVGEIVDRLAASLDENLVNLVGPKMQDLKVADPDKLYFKPKRLLATIAQIYLNLGGEAEFIRAVANDGRSYSKDLFERFARVLKHRAIMTEGEVSQVMAFTQRVENMVATIAVEEEREIPDDFLDPLMSTLMTDPVILPTSKISIDRKTIRTVLLSKEVDPFNNQPLKMEDCLPDIELKAKIDAWVAEGKSRLADEVMEVDQL